MLTDIYQPTKHEYAFTIQQAQEMRTRYDELKEEFKQVSQKRNTHKGQAKRPYTKRLKEIDSECETLYNALKECPPAPLSNELALGAILVELQRTEDNYQEVKEKVCERIKESRFCWSCSGYIPALVRLEVQAKRVAVIKDMASIFDVYDYLLFWNDEVLRQVVNSGNILNSTSPSSNLISYLEHEANVYTLTRTLPRLLESVENLCEAVKSWQELNPEQ